jgi:Immunoglobulin-like domain of bacterial spore germination
MKARGLAVLLIVAIGAGAAYWYLQSKEASSQASTEYTSKHGDKVTINAPKAGDGITSPLTVTGVVPGLWSFEANFPVEIVDADHKKVAEGYATVQGDWMTTKPVKFTATVPFKAPATDDGFVVIHKANPSGDQATDDSVEVPIKFGSG